MRNELIRLAVAAVIAIAPAVCANAQDAYRIYIETFSAMAVEQQQAHGIPASITLAQGLLESAAGRSTLATEGNNHFGIKCHSDWKGETMTRSDDAPDDCFRVYDDAADSYEDHSRFLMRKRYERLFDLDPTDYTGWAKGLKACGYATDPHYADRLVAIIERYGLNAFDTDAGRHAEETSEFIACALKSTHPIRKSRGLYYVVAYPGDTYASIAKEFHLKKKKLLAYNDVECDGEIKPWEEVYLQEKPDMLTDSPATAVIGEGESLHSLAQRYGVSLKTLKKLNQRVNDRPGERIKLR